MSESSTIALGQALAEGQAAWPQVRLAEGDLRAFLAAVKVSDEALRQHGADLYLVAACAAGVAAGYACFESRFLSQVGRYLGRMRLGDDVMDEVRQRLRVRMIGPEKKLTLYSGLAPLDRWLCLACVRLALDFIDSERRHASPDGEDELLRRVAGTDNPELNAIRDRYAPLIKRELRKAIEQLPDRDKTILRLNFVEGLNIESIGALYRVHRATVARWIADIRARLLHQLHQHIELEAGATPSEFASLLPYVKHELTLSLTRLLAP